MSQALGEKEWISAVAAGKILGVGVQTFQRKAGLWGVATRCLPGLKPRYSRYDVERIARESVSTGPRCPEASGVPAIA